jgi:nucleotide-binding universal stress UspA family protein
MPASWHLEDVVLKERRDHLDRLAAALRDEGIEGGAELLTGKPAEEITREVLRGAYDLVIKTTRGKQSTGVGLGTTALRLMRICPCAVWAVHATAEGGPYKKVLAAINPCEGESQRARLNRKVLEVARSLAEFEGSELHVIHAWEAYAQDVLTMKMSEEQIAEYHQAAHDEAEARVERFLSGFDFAVAMENVHLVKGFREDAIPEFARENQVDVIVMGTIGRAGMSGLVIGNSAERLLDRVECSVLAIKPDDFVSPVTPAPVQTTKT